MKKQIFLIALCAILAIPSAHAQLFYHTLRTPQSTLLNPAFFPTNNTFYLMLPGADIQFTSPLALNEVIYYDKPTDRTVIDLNNIFQRLNDNNDFNFNADINLLGFGFRINNTFINFNTRLVNNVHLGLPTSTIDAVLQGNIGEDNAPRPIIELVNGDIFNVNSYLEAAVGAAHYFEPLHLTVGLRAKLLYGIANIQTDNTKIVFNTDPNLDSVSASIYYQIQSASFVPYDTNKGFIFNVGDLFNISQASTGIAFDLGAKYDWGPFTFSLAINDLSPGIHWTNNVTTWTPSGGQGVITYNGLDVSTVLDNGTLNVDSITDYLREQISNMTPHREDEGDYWFAIPTKINLGASYSFAKIFRAGLLFHGQLDRGLISKSNATTGLGADPSNTFRFNTTLSFGANLFNWAEVVAGASIVYDGANTDFFNPGIGVILTPATIIQLYIMTDYISSFYLTDSKALNLKVGLNLLFGKGKRTVVSAE
jgi:hypothetical protein